MPMRIYEAKGKVQNGSSEAKARMPGRGLLPPAACAADDDDGDWVFRKPALSLSSERRLDPQWGRGGSRW
jgi:hypothetical protein